MARKRIARRISRTQRAKILATAKSQGLTAAQVEKKFKVSRWTYYGWRKNRGAGPRGAIRRGRPAGITTAGTTNIQASIRAALPSILREELARALSSLIGGGTVTRRRRRRKG